MSEFPETPHISTPALRCALHEVMVEQEVAEYSGALTYNYGMDIASGSDCTVETVRRDMQPIVVRGTNATRQLVEDLLQYHTLPTPLPRFSDVMFELRASFAGGVGLPSLAASQMEAIRRCVPHRASLALGYTYETEFRILQAVAETIPRCMPHRADMIFFDEVADFDLDAFRTVQQRGYPGTWRIITGEVYELPSNPRLRVRELHRRFLAQQRAFLEKPMLPWDSRATGSARQLRLWRGVTGAWKQRQNRGKRVMAGWR